MAQIFSFLLNTSVTNHMSCVLSSAVHIALQIRLSKTLLQKIVPSTITKQSFIWTMHFFCCAHVIPSWQADVTTLLVSVSSGRELG